MDNSNLKYREEDKVPSGFSAFGLIFIVQINPPHYIPLVEIIPAPWTEQAVIDRTIALMKDLGQAPVLAKKEVNGFIINRLQYALIMEAWRLVEVSGQ